MSIHRLPLLTLWCALAIALMGGCVNESIIDDISTELTVTRPGAPGQALEIRKRFRFSHDPADARAIFLSETRLQILAPAGEDLSFIHRLDVYVVDPREGNVLVAVGEGFTPGDRIVEIDVVYHDDLKGFAQEDSRIMFLFAIVPNTWHRPFPDGGITVLAKASLTIEI